MDREQAKEVLLRYQPGRDDTVDPEIVEALRLLDRDPELASWFEQQQRADDAIRAGFRNTPVPADLKEHILAEHKIVRPDFAWRRRTLIAAAAAAVVLGALTEWMWLSKPWQSMPVVDVGFSAYREQMVHYVSDRYSMNIRGSSFDELRQALAQRQWPTDFTVPDSLRSVTVVGGGALEWNGHKVAMACMKDGDHGLWLFVIDKTGLRDAPATETPRVQVVEASPTATWTQNGKTYLFTVQGDEAFLKKYLP